VSSEHERHDDASIPAHWRPAVRADVGALARAERTAAGGVRVKATVARSGILVYHHADGTMTRELVPAEEVARLESLASLRDAPVTVYHPTTEDGARRMVSPETYRADAVGHVSGEPTSDGRLVHAQLAIADAAAMRAIDAGELVELSAGYRLLLDPTPGTYEGQAYDAVQRQRIYNHVALLPKGGARAGEAASLRLDARDTDVAIERVDAPASRPAPPLAPTPTTTPSTRSDSVKTERIDGIEYEVGTAAHAQARAKFDAAQQERIDKLTKDAADARARVKELEGELAAAKKSLAEATDPKRLDAVVEQRAALLEAARAFLGDQDLSGKSDREVMMLVLEQLDPEVAAELDAEGEGEEKADDKTVRAHFNAQVRIARKNRADDASKAKRSPAGAARAAAFGQGRDRSDGALPEGFAGMTERDFLPDPSDRWRS
jgi:hypothetical protein